ncbi:MAG TPA: bifunctional shikimate kinase/3-dehydroquinate synthase [Solirubrobacteraceae bacterium]|nr:bifunctional shikimate kinase/3-dehydroquinate synthase [Solirubrobacteraceae bacterium]
MAAALTRQLVLVGFMGAGKSTAARELARLVGGSARDSDAELETRAGERIEALFDREGEAALRAREEEVVLELLGGPDAVVSLGGGALGSARVRDALHAQVTVLIDIDPDVAWSRVAGRGRPLARDRGAFDALYAAREPVYRAVADATLPCSDVRVLRRALGSLQALAAADGPMPRLLWATSASGDYPVWIGEGALARAPWPLEERSRRIVVSDEHVADLWAGRVPRLAGLIEIPAGEQHKTLATAELVWHALVAQQATREDHVVAVGGGVVGDLAGFCAATYQRGIPVVQVPTTLVAQVDSAYGGKTGVDLPEAKNYVGAYHQPAGVIADTATLETLPAEELAAGYAEVLKTALIAGGALWDRVGAGEAVDEAMIAACARTKLAVVAADERDGGRRQVLNLGHTIAHAIETVTGYARLRHGEAVGLGLLAALRLSGRDDLRGQVAGLLAGAGLPVSVDGVDAADVVEATWRDKKRTGEHVPFVLCDAPGAVRHGAQVAPGELLAAIAELTD